MRKSIVERLARSPLVFLFLPSSLPPSRRSLLSFRSSVFHSLPFLFSTLHLPPPPPYFLFFSVLLPPRLSLFSNSPPLPLFFFPFLVSNSYFSFFSLCPFSSISFCFLNFSSNLYLVYFLSVIKGLHFPHPPLSLCVGCVLFSLHFLSTNSSSRSSTSMSLCFFLYLYCSFPG